MSGVLDTVIAWTHFDPVSRDIFRRALDLDPETWSRGRGWALWKALITLGEQLERGDDDNAHTQRAVFDRAITDDG